MASIGQTSNYELIKMEIPKEWDNVTPSKGCVILTFNSTEAMRHYYDTALKVRLFGLATMLRSGVKDDAISINVHMKHVYDVHMQDVHSDPEEKDNTIKTMKEIMSYLKEVFGSDKVDSLLSQNK
jgi:hypothetical protein